MLIVCPCFVCVCVCLLIRGCWDVLSQSEAEPRALPATMLGLGQGLASPDEERRQGAASHHQFAQRLLSTGV